jgi:hypothetical protein
LREFSKFRDFSENRSVLFPSTLVTIAEGGSRHGKKLDFSRQRFCDWNFQSQKGNFIVTTPFRQIILGSDPQTNRFGDPRLKKNPIRVFTEHLNKHTV